MLEQILKNSFVLEEVSNKDKSPKLGEGYSTAVRYIWWNPLTYIVLFVIIIITFLMYGIKGFKNIENPFKWH